MSNSNPQTIQATKKTQKIDEQEVKRIANLAMISSHPDDDFLQKYAKELNNFLDYAQDFQSIDTTGILPTDIIPTNCVEDLRDDEPDPNQEEKERVRKNIIANFPQKQGDLLSIPKKIVE